VSITSNPSALTLSFAIGDDQYVVRTGALTGLDNREIRAVLGVGFTDLLADINDGKFDVDYLAALVWLARRQRGERQVKLTAILETITYDDMIAFRRVDDDGTETALSVEVGTAPPTGDSPEA
jgi:hypothetical protein